jgi:hypothetical protein
VAGYFYKRYQYAGFVHDSESHSSFKRQTGRTKRKTAPVGLDKLLQAPDIFIKKRKDRSIYISRPPNSVYDLKTLNCGTRVPLD